MIVHWSIVTEGIDGSVGRFMKRLFCRPYGTNPDVCMFCVPAVNYWAIVSYPYRDRNWYMQTGFANSVISVPSDSMEYARTLYTGFPKVLTWENPPPFAPT